MHLVGFLHYCVSIIFTDLISFRCIVLFYVYISILLYPCFYLLLRYFDSCSSLISVIDHSDYYSYNVKFNSQHVWLLRE